MVNLEKFIDLTNAATDKQEIFDIFKNSLADFGYDRIIYSMLTNHSSLNKIATHGIVHNYPNDWMEHYSQNNYFDIDPIIKHAFRTSSVYTWDCLSEHYCLNKRQKKVVSESKEAKLLDGIAIPIHGEKYELFGIGMASSLGGIKLSRDILSRICVLANQFHRAYSELDIKEFTGGESLLALTPREKEVLTWAAEGKSIASIAAILSISTRTVRDNLEKTYKKLGINDRTQVIMKAIYLGLIRPNHLHLFTKQP